ncbi:DUF4259 domain-containing protein [Kitasatospora sp. NA04385]|uniref:DUF4259 domain-containing protein n=1 Tax=Kitasatospora sp. NA04385 TaxID=2742135 RepID=UPI001591D22E|nr:DUF4259 domain-containing protein [Kitasatospora sp. NA04385]
MGTWGTGPFDSDLAGDFVDRLSGLPAQELAAVLGGALRRVVSAGDHVDGGDGQEAVAAAALIAAQLPGSGILIDLEDGPEEPLPPARPRCAHRHALHFSGSSAVAPNLHKVGRTAAMPANGAVKCR